MFAGDLFQLFALEQEGLTTTRQGRINAAVRDLERNPYLSIEQVLYNHDLALSDLTIEEKLKFENLKNF